MADQAKFDHDRLGHLLEDKLLMVPRFQRSYAWDHSNIQEYLDDLTGARRSKREYFMGTIVLADSDEEPRQIIVDGQQRLTTTALLLIAIRDQLRKLGKDADADSIETRYIRRYELSEGEELIRLVLSPTDLPDYESLVDGEDVEGSALAEAYQLCLTYVEELAPGPPQFQSLIDLTSQLADEVQILLAIASGIPEAYVIFETLNDRGADLTTADLLKNYLFSQAGQQGIGFVESVWTEISGSFEKPDDLVKFIRYDYSSRHGKVTNRKLYRSLQEVIGGGSGKAKTYMKELRKSHAVFQALKDPDHERWGRLNFDVRDSLIAFRRFGFESSMPLLLAVFREWQENKAGKIVNLVAAWSVRALMAGKLGGGQSEEAFCQAAVAVSSRKARSQPDLLEHVGDIVPGNSEFRQSFLGFGPLTTTRAKYLLGMIERTYRAKNILPVAPLDWSSKSVTIEHVIADSSKDSDFANRAEFERFLVLRNRLWNFALLERTLNKKADDQAFVDKKKYYDQSGFAMTQLLGSNASWTVEEGEAYAQDLADLAVETWSR